MGYRTTEALMTSGLECKLDRLKRAAYNAVLRGQMGKASLFLGEAARSMIDIDPTRALNFHRGQQVYAGLHNNSLR